MDLMKWFRRKDENSCLKEGGIVKGGHFGEDDSDRVANQEPSSRFRRFCDLLVDCGSKGDIGCRIQLPVRIGMGVIIVFFGIGGLWAALAPLEGAVIAPGQVELYSKNQMVQHLEGGVIEEIFVQEGDRVQRGQPLLSLTKVNVESQLAILRERLLALNVTHARLVAEQQEQLTFTFDLNQDPGNGVTYGRREEIFQNQLSLFEARKSLRKGQVDVLKNRIQQSYNEIEGIEHQCKAVIDQTRLTTEELDAKKQLVGDGSISRPQILNLEKQYSMLLGRRGEYKSAIARVGQHISEAELEILNIKYKFHNEVVNELKTINLEIGDTHEKLKSFLDVLSRTTVRAPQNGIVNNLRYHTRGGVVSPGSVILEIVPVEDKMVIDVKIEPNSIEAVLAARQDKTLQVDRGGISGTAVKVRMTAYNAKRLGLIEGVLQYVSADLVIEAATGRGFYSAKVVVPEESLVDINNEGISLYPGMPVLVYIVTESRTLLSYLFMPLIYSFMNAFRER